MIQHLVCCGNMSDTDDVESVVNDIFKLCDVENEITSALCKVKIKIPALKVGCSWSF